MDLGKGTMASNTGICTQHTIKTSTCFYNTFKISTYPNVQQQRIRSSCLNVQQQLKRYNVTLYVFEFSANLRL